MKREIEVPQPILLLRQGPGGEPVEFEAVHGLTIGSDEGAGFSLSAQGLAAIHCRIVVDSLGTSIEESGGPLIVNGKKASRVLLRSGDSIHLGKVRFVFLEPGGMVGDTEGSATPGRRQRGRLVWAAASLLLLVLVWHVAGPGGKETNGGADRVAGAFAEARAAVVAGRWEQALESLDAAEDPQTRHAELERYRALVLEELEQQRLVGRLLACIGVADVSCATGSWEALDKTSLNFGREEAALLEAMALLPSARGTEEGAEPLLSAELSSGIDAIPPGTIGADLKGVGAARGAPALQVVGKPGERNPGSRQGSSGVRRKRVTREEILSTWSGGRVAVAIAMAHGLGTTEGQGLATAFQRYDVASEKAEASSGAAAFPWLEQLVSIERELGMRAERGERARRRLADLHVEAGRHAEAVSDWDRALRHHRLGAGVLEDHVAAREGIRRIQRHADRIYLEGYAAREIAPELARERFAQAIRLLPDGHATRGKAMRWLDGLTQPGRSRQLGSLSP